MSNYEVERNICTMCGAQAKNTTLCKKCSSQYSQICCINCGRMVTFSINTSYDKICVSCRAKDYIAQLNQEDISHLVSLAKSKRVIEAIRETRNILSISLKDAIDVVDELLNNSQVTTEIRGE